MASAPNAKSSRCRFVDAQGFDLRQVAAERDAVDCVCAAAMPIGDLAVVASLPWRFTLKQAGYLADGDVASFIEWAGHLVRGDWGLKHNWKGKGPSFQCDTFYQAFERYLWPNTTNGQNFDTTIRTLTEFRQEFNTIKGISSPEARDKFVDIARRIVRWGGIRLPKLDMWAQMKPDRLQSHIDEVKTKLNPSSADTDDLRGFEYMGSGFSKIYSVLVPGLPIYDSRVACALACLVRLYRRDARLSEVPPLLNLPVPRGRVVGRCPLKNQPPLIAYGQSAKYAQANLQAAWLLQKLVEFPGSFDAVPEGQRLDALQSALFMIGYKRLSPGAIVKPQLRYGTKPIPEMT